MVFGKRSEWEAEQTPKFMGPKVKKSHSSYWWFKNNLTTTTHEKNNNNNTNGAVFFPIIIHQFQMTSNECQVETQCPLDLKQSHPVIHIFSSLVL